MNRRRLVSIGIAGLIIIIAILGLLFLSRGRLLPERAVNYSSAHDPLWSADRNLLVYAVDIRATVGRRHRIENPVVSGELWIMDLDTGKSARLYSIEKESMHPFGWSQDGQEIYLRRSGRMDLVWRLPLDGENRPLTLLQATGFEGCSSSTDGFYYFAGRRSSTSDELWFCSLKEMTPRRLAVFDLASQGAIVLEQCAVSPDDSRLLVVTRRELSPGAPLPSLGPVPPPTPPPGRATPGGSAPLPAGIPSLTTPETVADSPAPGAGPVVVDTAWIFNLIEPEQTTLGTWEKVDLRWAPVGVSLGGMLGSNIAVIDFGPRMVTIKPQTAVPGGAPGWFSDGQKLAFITVDEAQNLEMLQSIDLAGGVKKIYFHPAGKPGPWGYHCAWKPRSSTIAFELADELSRTNIALVNEDGSGFRLLTTSDLVR